MCMAGDSRSHAGALPPARLTAVGQVVVACGRIRARLFCLLDTPVVKGIARMFGARTMGKAAVLVGAAMVWLLGRPDEHVVASAPTVRPAAVQLPSSAAIPPSAPIPAVTSAKREDTVPSLSAKVKELSASTDARDAFTAYHILSQCKSARDEEWRYQQTRQAERDPQRAALVQAGVVGSKAVEQACGDLQDGDFKARLALVERAAERGVPMAALRLATEGPWGDQQALYTRWEDPLVQEWRAKVIRLIEMAARKGDVMALGSIQAQYEDGLGLIEEKDPERALQYAVAKHIVYEAQTGRTIWGAKRELEEMTAAVSPEVAMRARSAGEKLAKEALAGKAK